MADPLTISLVAAGATTVVSTISSLIKVFRESMKLEPQGDDAGSPSPNQYQEVLSNIDLEQKPWKF
jgi:hypothetical protein